MEIYQSTGEILPIVRLRATYNDKPGEPEAFEDFETLAYIQVAIDHLPKPANDPYWLQFDPKDGFGVMVEQQGQMLTYDDGPMWNQYIDHIEAPPGTRAILTDYKSRSNFRYNKTPAELAQDVQLMTNARWLFNASTYETILLRHLNLLTTGRAKCVPVVTEVTRPQVEDFYQNNVLPTVREMEAHAAINSDPLALPPNTESCDKYGGCPKRGACGFDVAPKLFNITGRKVFDMGSISGSSVLDGLLGKTAPAAPVVGVVVPATSPALPAALGALIGKTSDGTVTGIVTPAVGSPAAPPIVSSLAALLGKAPATEPAPVVVPPSAFRAAAIAAGYPVNFAPTGGIVPPDAPPATSTPEEVAEANKANTTETEDEESQETGTAPSLEAAGGPETAPSADGKVRRKRRTKAEMEAARAAEATAATPGVPVVNLPAGSVPADLASKLGMTVTGVSPPTENVVNAPTVASLSALLGQTAVMVGGAQIHVGGTAPETPRDKTPEEIAEVSAKQPAPAPIDPVKEQLKARVSTPDPSLACPVKYLFIDCLPSKGWPEEHTPKSLHEFWHAFTTNAASAAGKADYRFVKYESKGYLSASIRAMLRGLPSSIYVDSSIPDVQEFITAVLPYCDMVFMGR